MKKSFRLLPIAALAAIAGAMITPARAAITVTLTDAAGTTTCGPVAGNVLTCTTADAAYTIVVATVTDNSPGGPAEQTKSLTITSTAAAIGNPLTIEAGSTGFLLPSGPSLLTESVTANNPGATAFGSVTGQGYVSLSNTALDFSGATTGPATVTCTSLGAPGCGALGAFIGTTTVQGPPGGTTLTTPFALNEILTVTTTVPGLANFTADLTATSVPEPMSIALLGGILLMTTGAIRRKRNQASRG